MEEEKLCGVCEKMPATKTCHECGIPLCDACAREVVLSEPSLGYQVQGTSISSIRRAEEKRIVCEKCMKEVDFF